MNEFARLWPVDGASSRFLVAAAALLVAAGCGSELSTSDAGELGGDSLKGGVRVCRTTNDTNCCGNARCETKESCEVCAADCPCTPPDPCGNGTCDAAEDCLSCEADCGVCPEPCGDGTCAADEDCVSCAADCRCPPTPGVETIALECEGGTLVGGMQRVTAAGASAGAFAEAAAGTAIFTWSASTPQLPPARSELAVRLQGGTYRLWVRMAAPSGDADALYAGFGATDLRRFYPASGYVYGSSWTWLGTVAGDAARLQYTLVAGDHVLAIGSGETGARCDAVVLTSDPSWLPPVEPPVTDRCGDGTCAADEDCTTCAADCTCLPFCGDQSCDAAESCTSCATDCGECPPPTGPARAFPGAMGFGAVARGGRGGQVVKVTNLNDAGAGSLRQALYYTPGPRIVVFEVAGVINLASVLVIREPFVTIAGQTAPAPGITLADYGLRIYTHDVVVQHLFVRPSPALDAGGGDGIAIKVSLPDVPYNIVLDHCSVSWAYDENVSVFAGYGNEGDENVTISNCLVAEGHYGLLLGGSSTRVSLLRNVVMSAVERHPRLGGRTWVNIVNNLLYNADGASFTVVGDAIEGADRVSVVGNRYIDGPSTNTGSAGVAVLATATPGTQVYAPASGIYANIASNNVTRASDAQFLVSAPPVPVDDLEILPAADVEAFIAANVGARPAERATVHGDAADLRFISEIQNRTGSVKDRAQPPWTRPASGARRDLTALLPANPSADDDGDGYTNIEEVLAQMAAAIE